MKALMKTKPELGFSLVEVEQPTIGHDDILVKIKKTSICGTDLHIYHWDKWAQETVPVPLIVGHEFVGEVVAIGEHVTTFKIGDRVSGENHIGCGSCRNCRAGRPHICRKNISIGVTHPGCFAEYLSIPAANAYLIPPDISDNIASILNPFGNAVHCALSFNVVGEDVLITGAGPVGIMAVAVVKHIGARHIVITDTNEYRLAIAKKMGASVALNVNTRSLKEVMRELNMQEGFDIGLEMSGHSQAFNDMLTHMNHAGKIALLGFLPQETQIDWNHIILKGLTLQGIYGREMFETWYKMIALIQSGVDLTPVITHEFSIDEYETIFETLKTGQCGKIVIRW